MRDSAAWMSQVAVSNGCSCATAGRAASCARARSATKGRWRRAFFILPISPLPRRSDWIFRTSAQARGGFTAREAVCRHGGRCTCHGPPCLIQPPAGSSGHLIVRLFLPLTLVADRLRPIDVGGDARRVVLLVVAGEIFL